MDAEIDAYAMTDGKKILINGVGSNAHEAAVNLEFVGDPALDKAPDALRAIPVTISTTRDRATGGKMIAGGFALVVGDTIYPNGVAETAGQVSRAAGAIEMEVHERSVYDILDVLVIAKD